MGEGDAGRRTCWVVGIGVERASQHAKVESSFKRKADLGGAPPPTMGRTCARSLHGVREAVLEAEGKVDAQKGYRGCVTYEAE